MLLKTATATLCLLLRILTALSENYYTVTPARLLRQKERPQIKRTQAKHEILEVCPVFLILLIKCSNAFGKFPKSMVCGKQENN